MKLIVFIFSILFACRIAYGLDVSENPAVYVSSGTNDVIISTVNIISYPEIFSSTVPLHIMHPAQDKVLPFVKSSFVFGWADPAGRLAINEKIVPIHQGGGFLAMVDYSTGTFNICAKLELGATTYTDIRTIYVTPRYMPLPVSPVTVQYTEPVEDESISPGDILFVKCKASPDCKAIFQIQGVKRKIPMIEAETLSPGMYCGSYVVQEKDNFKNSRIKIVLTNKKLGKKTFALTEGRVSRFDQGIPQIVEISTDTAVIYAGSSLSRSENAGYMLFPVKGTRLRVTGRIGNELKVRLNQTREGWVNEKDVISLPQGVVPVKAIAENVSIKIIEPNTVVSMQLSDKIPFEVNSSFDRHVIDITFFGVVSNTDWITYESTRTIVQEAQWFQDDSETYRLRICLKDNQWWGYDVQFEENNFLFELKLPPVRRSTSALEGITIALDAGHSPDNGAVGPTGLLEKDANWNIVYQLQKILLNEGVKVVIVRQKDEALGLYDRPRRARQEHSDILVSVHNNALGEGKNPLEKNGYGVYYFYPHSLPLAEEISIAFGKIVGKESKVPVQLRDDGISYGNLALTRVCEMPAVLIECAYIIAPQEEALLKNGRFQKLCAEAIFAGLERYAAKMRNIERGRK